MASQGTLLAPIALARCRLTVRGQVQGVGFRPFVYRLARELHLGGWVSNDGDGVELDIEGSVADVVEFGRRLRTEAPPLARIQQVEEASLEPHGMPVAFEIRASGKGRVTTGITVDTTVCPACLAELFEPANRRYRYPFINCTHCGPRYTLTRELPYDRANTTMSVFPQCPACGREYRDPMHRRFHAQPNCCPACGPTLRLLGPDGEDVAVEDPIAAAVRRLERGEILAVKGLGGFHLVCDARNAQAVAALRRRKHREEKPFAIMVLNTASLRATTEISGHTEELLSQAERPIVLLPKRPGADAELEGIAPGMGWVGAMLPYTPLHYLLFHEWAGRPVGMDWLDQPHPAMLVMTSANPGGEPLVKDNAQAVAQLHGIADGFLVHDRDIAVRCDDSVVRADGGEARFIRRGRGYAPAPIRLAHSGPSVLALGAFLKNTFCVTRGNGAYLSQHIGDLDNASTCIALEESITHFLSVLQVTPDLVACDRHPDFFSTHLAQRMAMDRDIPCVPVQHHHAHIAAVLAEHRVEGPVLGLALDGVGLGDDGGIWGGELLHLEGAGYRRVGHLSPLPMPGGDRAAREPWRMAAGALHAMGRGDEIPSRFAGQANALQLEQMIARGNHCAASSSAGRLFDAAAGLLGIKPVAHFEGQAAMMLEALAERYGEATPWRGGYSISERGDSIDFLPLLGRLADCRDAGEGAALFHGTVASGLAEWVAVMASRHQLSQVVLGGGCFLNRILSRELARLLRAEGLDVFSARQAPPNDGGISLGQAWVAMRSWGSP